MAQSDIQSYLQQVAGTHTLGQSNLPSGVNNGNPNTVYNYKPPEGGYLPPVSNAYDQWRINPLPTSQNAINWQQMANQGGFNFNLQGLAPKPVPGTPVPGGTPTPTPNTGGGYPPVPVPGTGGGGTPTPTPTPVPTGSGGNQGGGGYGGGGTNGGRGADWYDFGGDRTQIGGLISDKPSSSHTDYSTSASDSAGWGGLMSQNEINEFMGSGMPLGDFGKSLYGTPIGEAMGVKSDGSIAFGQLVDFFLPGNVYMGQTGKWNFLNALPALASRISPVLGLAVKTFMKYLAAHTNIKALKNWAAKNLENQQAGRGGAGGNGSVNGGSSGGLLGGDLGVGMGLGDDPLGSMLGSGSSISYGDIYGRGDIWGQGDPTAAQGPFFHQDQGDVNQN